jgi:hypothetical protein
MMDTKRTNPDIGKTADLTSSQSTIRLLPSREFENGGWFETDLLRMNAFPREVHERQVHGT